MRSHTQRRHFAYFSLALLVLMTLARPSASAPASASPFPSPTPTPPASTPAPEYILHRLDTLDALVAQNQTMMEVQSRSFDAAIARMESNTNLVLFILAVASILLAVLGFGIVRGWVGSVVEQSLKRLAGDQISRAIQDEIGRIRAEWDAKFADLYEEYRRSIRK